MEEGLILRDKPSLVPILVYWPATAIVFACPLVLLVLLLKDAGVFLGIYGIIFVLVLMGVIARMAIDIVAREFNILTLTETALVRERGILNRNYDRIPLEKVQTAHIRYPLAGQILDYGNITITTAGGRIYFPSLPRPKTWEKEILKRIR